MTTKRVPDQLARGTRRAASGRRTTVLCGAVLLAAALSGCGGGGGHGKTSGGHTAAAPTGAARSTASADPDTAEKKAVIAAYDAMWVEQMKAYHQASTKGTDVEKYETLDALSELELDLKQMRKAGGVVRGEMGHKVKVTGLDMDAKIPKASLSDCVDLSKWQTYDVKTKKVIPLPKNQPLHYIATAKEQKWHGRWLVTDLDPQGGPPKC